MHNIIKMVHTCTEDGTTHVAIHLYAQVYRYVVFSCQTAHISNYTISYISTSLCIWSQEGTISALSILYYDHDHM